MTSQLTTIASSPAAAAHAALATHQLQLTRPTHLHTGRIVAAVQHRQLHTQRFTICHHLLRNTWQRCIKVIAACLLRLV
jgi:hypothetical protein